MKFLVKCTVFVEVEIEDSYAGNAFHWIEDSGCPGTGLVGLAIDEAIKASKKSSTCWACNLKGTNEIVAINGVLVDRRTVKG